MIIKITEEQCRLLSEGSAQLFEDVFINNLKTSRGKNVANLTYAKNSNGYNKGNKSSFDMLKTGRMDNGNGNNTYEVPLKGGLISFNITDINGTEVMHYFKRAFEHEQTVIKINGEGYNLEMENSEFGSFMETFLNKVSSVVNYQINVFKQQDKNLSFNGIYIYPVPSSSNFNDEMTKRIIQNSHTIDGLPVSQLNTSILKKNPINLQKDDEFIEKNKDYYNSERFGVGPKGVTHIQDVDNTINRLTKSDGINQAIANANEIVDRLIRKYYQLNNQIKKNMVSQKTLNGLSEIFTEYQDSVRGIVRAGNWFDVISQRTHNPQLASIAKAIKYSKGPSVEKRTNEIYDILKSNGLIKGVYRNKVFDICYWEPVDFQIKLLGNDTRMALKNYFAPNNDDNLVKQEIEKTQGNVVVVFDDNVSGGSTLSDICMNLKNLGVEYIIPITFGRMRASYNQGMNITINKPENGFNMN